MPAEPGLGGSDEPSDAENDQLAQPKYGWSVTISVPGEACRQAAASIPSVIHSLVLTLTTTILISQALLQKRTRSSRHATDGLPGDHT